ncbi:MAG: acetyl-CoA hydrolase/transferase C-terminal domain-containing protein [Halopseudomonas sp.]|uniref:acetyl-CoA hydrolase/transferase C-terminal domain-containing protein n=1 Tax=Halopseudomonas sp. TaxID=2901191 RepID=UPI0030014FFB
MSELPHCFQDAEALVDAILQRLGNTLVVGLPLGLGKANHLINALYRRARDNAEISLTICTALTLEAPSASSDLEQGFIGPLSARLFADYPALEYAGALRKGTLPHNVRVREFFLRPGGWLGVPQAQQDYTSLNYTHALDTLLRWQVNLILQLVAPGAPAAHGQPGRYSLSCNPDISADLLDRRQSGELKLLSVGQINHALPYMGGAADRPAADFDLILQSPQYEFPLFTPPHSPAALKHHAIGLRVASLIPDGGTLQIGIGSIGDAIANALRLRQQQPLDFQQLLQLLESPQALKTRHRDPFVLGLYGVTEMLVEGFLALIEAGVIKREVNGKLIHAGFFIGSPILYETLQRLPAETRDKIAMMPVSFTNSLYGNEEDKREARQQARFINSALMVSLSGAVTSDGLADGQVISGVGGQYDFIAQAFALNDARAIITLPATRTHKGKVSSNICWQYPHTTIPRHLRDMVVTEYGVADLRDKSDAEVMDAMLSICDARFQEALMAQAQRAGKLPADYRLPASYGRNTPEQLAQLLAESQRQGLLPAFPLGSGLSAEEEDLAQALSELKTQVGSKRALLATLCSGLRKDAGVRQQAALQRMQLERPKGLRQRIYRLLLLATLPG